MKVRFILIALNGTPFFYSYYILRQISLVATQQCSVVYGAALPSVAESVIVELLGQTSDQGVHFPMQTTAPEDTYHGSRFDKYAAHSPPI